MDLQEGTYNAYCPMDDHEQKGMKVKLAVR